MEEKISRIIFDAESLGSIKLISACIPFKNTVKTYNISSICDTQWWLGNEPETNICNKKVVKYAQGTIFFETIHYHESRGVRPMVTFKSGILKVGNEFFVDKWLFKVIAPGLAICETIIGYSPYAFKHQKTVPLFIDSALFCYLDQWFKNIANAPVYKITRETCDNNIVKYASLPTLRETSEYYSFFIANGYPYWVRTRKDEFTGYYITPNGEQKTANISEKLFINPVVYLDTENEGFNKFKPFDIFVIQGRGFKLLNTQSGISFGLNPLNPSCYSTGIIKKGNSEEEEEFFKNSEAYQVLKNWTKFNKLKKLI